MPSEQPTYTLLRYSRRRDIQGKPAALIEWKGVRDWYTRANILHAIKIDGWHSELQKALEYYDAKESYSIYGGNDAE